MLACTALVGCTDEDVIENGMEENKPQAEQMRAYMTFSIASSTNSSRGVGEGTTNGDNHGNAEHSGHESEGTTDENQVNSILVCFYNTAAESTDGFCDLFEMNSEGDEGDEFTYNGYSTKLQKVGQTDTYALEKPFALNSLGEYKVLIVINPAYALQNKTANNATGAKSIYNEIVTSYAASVDAIIGANKDNFMMANRKEITINVTANNNDASNPAEYEDGPIEVERVASKITFRPTNNNQYTIKETTYRYNITTGNFWFKDTDNVYKYLSNLYKAQDTDKNVYWVYVDGTTTKRYKIDENFQGSNDDKLGEGGNATGDGLYEGELASGNTKAQVVVAVTDAEENSKTIVYVGTKSPTNETKNYTVKLTKYALVNLNNKVYYVRHTAVDPATATSANAWGFVTPTDSKYLIEPNTPTKSAAVTTWGTPLAWPWEATAASSLYNNDFKTVTDDIATNGTNSTYLEPLNATGNGETVTNTVTPSDTGLEQGINPEYETTGFTLDYCLENSMLAANQNALTSTSIIFEAQIYDNEDKVVDHMLEYNGSFYSNFAALVEATEKTDGDITTSPFWKYTDEDYSKMTEEQKVDLASDLATQDVTLYQDGKCYYFSAEIKHFDDGKDNENGVMEYAIMRNNIYSLAVTDVNGFGFSNIDLQSGVLNNSTEEKEKVYMTMTAKILPWIVRFNDINF